MKPKVLIFGLGNQARMAHVCLSRDSPYEVAAFVSYAKYIASESFLGLPVVAFESVAETYSPAEYEMFVALGFTDVNRVRAQVFDECRRLGYRFASYISSRISQWGDVAFGDNCFVLDLTSIQPFVTIGDDVVIGPGVIIGHDVVIGDHSFIGPGVTIPGMVRIGRHCVIGGNSVLKDGVAVADDCIISAGSRILRNTRPGELYMEKPTPPARLPSRALGRFTGGAPARPAAGPADEAEGEKTADGVE